jgi:hypothetical protein
MNAREKWQLLCIKIVTPTAQFIGLSVVAIVMILMARHAFLSFSSNEPSPKVFSTTPRQVKEWGGNTTEVLVGLHVNNFPEFDIVNNKFTIDAIIWFEFDPALVSLETVEKFSFDKGDIIKKTTSDTKVIEGKFFAQFNITVKFTTNLLFEMFPLDDHRIYLTLTNKFVSPSEMMYQAFISGFTLSEDMFVAGWQPVGHNVLTGYSEARLDEGDTKKLVLNPKVVFSIDFKRFGTQRIFLIFMPIFLMFFIGVLSFAFDPTKERRISMSLALGAVTAMLSYRFVIQGMSPQTGYFLLSDYIFTLFLGLAFMCFILGIIFMCYDEFVPRLVEIRAIALISFYVLILTLWYYFLYIWMGI